MKSVVRALSRRWFTPAPAARLGLLRVAVGAYSLWYLRRRLGMFERIAGTDPKLFRPVGPARILDKPLPPQFARPLTLATLAANLAFLAGWRHRQSGPAFAGLLLWTLSYRNSWSMIYHSDNLLVLHAGVLGLTRSADAYSLDSLRTGFPAGTREHWRYGWPLQLINGVTAAAYLLAGVAKVRGPLGWAWAEGGALRRQVAVDGLRKELLGDGGAKLAGRMHDHVGLYRVMAVTSLATELGAPLALLDKRLLRAWALGALGMHWGIYGIMKIKFRYQQSGVVFAPCFDIERVPQALARAAGAAR